MQPSSARTKRVHEGINSFARVLQPFGHQVSGVFGKSAGAIERLGSQIFAADFQAQGPDPGLSARLFGERDHGLAQLLPAIWFAQIELVEQGKAAVKLQAETIGDSEIAGKFSTAKDEVDLSMARIVEDLLDRAGSYRLIKTHMLLRVKFAHHLQQSGEFLVGKKLKERVHSAILNELASPNTAFGYNSQPSLNHWRTHA